MRLPTLKSTKSKVNNASVKVERRRDLRGDIKRLTGRRIVTVTLEDGLLRVVAINNKQVVAWGVAAIGKKEDSVAPDRPIPITIQQVDGRVWTHYLKPNARPLRVIADLPFSATLVCQFSIPKVKRQDLNQLVLAEIADRLPFTPDEVDSAWQVCRNGTAQSVFAAVVAKKAGDGHFTALREMGLRPVAAYPKAIALAFAAGIPDAVVAHLGSTYADLVLIRGRVPCVMHRVDFPPQEAGPQQQAVALARAVQWVTGYFENTGGGATSRLMPVVVGGLNVSRDLLASLGQMTQRQVLPFSPHLQYPAQFPLTEYVNNIGLALADQARTTGGKAWRGSVPPVNLIPERYRPRPLSLKLVLGGVTFLLLAGLTFPAATRANSAESEANALSSQATILKNQAREHQLDIARVKADTKRLLATDQQILGLESTLTQFDGELRRFLAQLETINGVALPANARLLQLGRQREEFAVLGTASTFEDAFQYVENLRASGFFSTVAMTRVDKSPGPQTSEGGQTAGQGKVVFHVKASAVSAPIQSPGGSTDNSLGSGPSISRALGDESVAEARRR